MFVCDAYEKRIRGAVNGVSPKNLQSTYININKYKKQIKKKVYCLNIKPDILRLLE
jgi:hypothetical protein